MSGKQSVDTVDTNSFPDVGAVITRSVSKRLERSFKPLNVNVPEISSEMCKI